MEYAGLFEPAAEGGYVITFPDFGWGVSQGDTEDEANEMARALLQTLIQEHMRGGKPLPRPRKLRSKRLRPVQLPALQAVKVELYNAFVAAGIRKSEFARLLGIPKTTVDRLFNFDNHTRLDQLEAAFRALGKHITVVVHDAA